MRLYPQKQLGHRRGLEAKSCQDDLEQNRPESIRQLRRLQDKLWLKTAAYLRLACRFGTLPRSSILRIDLSGGPTNRRIRSRSSSTDSSLAHRPLLYNSPPKRSTSICSLPRRCVVKRN